MIESKFLEEIHPYTGGELSSQFGHLTAGVLGNSIISWIGPCDVKTDQLVDGEDIINNDFIYSESMLHFIVEMFHQNIFYGIWLQRFMTMSLREIIFDKTNKLLDRKGDDLYLEDKKLNVSIATVSSVSTLVHFGINVIAKGAPVSALGLSDLDLDPKTIAQELMGKVTKEILEIDKASKKVFTV